MTEAKFCNQCGKENVIGMQFCPNCGASQQLLQNQNEPNQPKMATQPPPLAVEWFYSDDGKKIGPVAEKELVALISKGTLMPDTNIWSKGMNDWTPLNKSSLAWHLGATQPPPLPKKLVGDGYIWALALAPIWGAALQAFVAGMVLASSHKISPDDPYWNLAFNIQMQKLWWVLLVCNVLVGILDERKLVAAGYANINKKLSVWLAFLVPIYIYKRDKLLDAGMTRFWVWIGSFIILLLYF